MSKLNFFKRSRSRSQKQEIDLKLPIFANIYVNFSIFFMIWFVYLIFIFTTTMPFNLIYFHTPNTFKVKVMVTETSIFWSKIGNFENIC